MGLFDRAPEDPAVFRAEALRCRELAERLDGDDRRLMLRIARDNESRAMVIDATLRARDRRGRA